MKDKSPKDPFRQFGLRSLLQDRQQVPFSSLCWIKYPINVKFQERVSFLGQTKKNVAHTALREWSRFLRMTIGSSLGRVLAPFPSSSILNENRMMDSDLTEAYFIWHAQSIFPSFGTGLCRKWNLFH